MLSGKPEGAVAGSSVPFHAALTHDLCALLC